MIEGLPRAAFVLEIVAVVTVIGTAYAHLRHQRNRRFDVEEAVATNAFAALAIGTMLQVLSVLAR